MKKKLLMVFVAVALWSCGDDKKEEGGDSKGDGHEHHDGHDHGDHDHGDHDHSHGAEWKEADNFHEFMAETWHSAEDGNFEPVLGKARDMANAAKTWSESEIPTDYQKEGVADLLVMLKDESGALADLVDSGASTDTIFVALEALHNLFHKVVEECNGGHDHHHGDGHDHGDHDHGHDGDHDHDHGDHEH